MGPRQDASSAATRRVVSWLLARPLPLTPQSPDSCGPAAPTTLADADWPTGLTTAFPTLRVKVIGIDEATPVTGTQILASVHPDDLPTLKAAIAALRPDQPTLHVTYRMIRSDGTVIWVERSSRAYFDEHGKLARIVGMVADTTARKLAEEALAGVHTMSHGLHPSKLELLGLVAAMRSCCNEISAQQKVDIQFRHRDVPRDVSLCLFRVLQEALHNAVKHSGVREVGVELRGAPDSIDLIVHDGGNGFDAVELISARGLGLTSMRERLKLVHGELSIDSRFHRGTRLHAHSCAVQW